MKSYLGMLVILMAFSGCAALEVGVKGCIDPKPINAVLAQIKAESGQIIRRCAGVLTKGDTSDLSASVTAEFKPEPK